MKIFCESWCGIYSPVYFFGSPHTNMNLGLPSFLEFHWLSPSAVVHINGSTYTQVLLRNFGVWHSYMMLRLPSLTRKACWAVRYKKLSFKSMKRHACISTSSMQPTYCISFPLSQFLRLKKLHLVLLVCSFPNHWNTGQPSSVVQLTCLNWTTKLIYYQASTSPVIHQAQNTCSCYPVCSFICSFRAIGFFRL